MIEESRLFTVLLLGAPALVTAPFISLTATFVFSHAIYHELEPVSASYFECNWFFVAGYLVEVPVLGRRGSFAISTCTSWADFVS